MESTEADKTAVSSKTAETRPTKKKVAPKAPIDEKAASLKTTEKKRKAPKLPAPTDINEYEHIDETKDDKTLNKEDDTQVASTQDQEVPVKSKKKRAPKAENIESVSTEEQTKKKKSKAQKDTVNDDEFQVIDSIPADVIDPASETKPKGKKTKKSKLSTQIKADSFEEIKVTNLDDTDPLDEEINATTSDAAQVFDLENLPPPPDDIGEYERSIMDAYNNLASQVNFAQFVGDDQWCVIHLPKTARTEPKSRIRRMLPGGNNNKDDKTNKKPPAVPKGNIFNRLRTSMTTLMRDPNNLVFGERPYFEYMDYDDEPDGVDTDDLHRYAQKLRELEDQDREVNPEFLVLRDGKTVYGVHESDGDGKVKLATRKPIYDRFADQRPDEQTEKKKLLSRLKLPFTRNKDKDGKDSNSPKSANGTPKAHIQRKSSRNSLNEDLNAIPSDYPSMN